MQEKAPKMQPSLPQWQRALQLQSKKFQTSSWNQNRKFQRAHKAWIHNKIIDGG
jgi:uncharacterized protein involved in type VI secretion and phage assembly